MKKVEAFIRHEAFDAIRMYPQVLNDVSRRSLQCSLFGRPLGAPMVVAPMSPTGLAWYEGELAAALAARGLGVGKHVVGHAVGRDHACLVGDIELLENLHCVLHGVPVAAGTHDDADLDGFHGVWGWRCGCAEQPLAMDGTRDFTFCVPPRHIRWQAWAKIARTCL